jgi:cytochrome c peroxidase
MAHEAEMGHTINGVVARLRASGRYKGMFFAAFKDSLATGQTVLRALAQYTAALESYKSRYDLYIRQDTAAHYTQQEVAGLALFRQNCAKCHPEPLFTDGTMANIGLPPDSDYFDLGRYKITRQPLDSFAFKVPTLRNVAYTFPYMHDGRFTKLKQVLEHYTKPQTGAKGTLDPRLPSPMPLTPAEQKDIIAFLLTLTDKEFLFDKRFLP